MKLVEPVVVFLTAHNSQPFRRHLADHGIKHCYEKPIQIEQLKDILALAL